MAIELIARSFSRFVANTIESSELAVELRVSVMERDPLGLFLQFWHPII